MKINYSKKIITYAIMAIMVLSSVLLVVLPKKEMSENENRYLASFPKLTRESFFSGDYMQDIEIYINDQFPFRDTIVGIKSQLERLLGKKDFNHIYLGKDGFLIQMYEGYDLELLKEHTEAIDTFAKRINADTYVLVVPTSNAVYSDKKPKNAYDSDELADIQLFYQHLNIAKPVNVNDRLLENSSNTLLYFKQDHHWNTNGAYLAYLDFCDAADLEAIDINQFDIETVSYDFFGTYYSLSKIYTLPPDILQIYEPLFYTDIHVIDTESNSQANSLYHFENLETKNKYRIFLNGNHPELIIENKAVPGDDSILVIKDSYANCFIPFLTNHYRTVYVIDMRLCDYDLCEYVKENSINHVLILYSISTLRTDGSILRIN